ncbi:uncharacterized protein [Temnothorax nylanderi]|uniref:uncharacterized protein n=1 Tax=Temnothorax nylanderi TaxID=102681 RepID=UPI003A85BD81
MLQTFSIFPTPAWPCGLLHSCSLPPSLAPYPFPSPSPHPSLLLLLSLLFLPFLPLLTPPPLSVLYPYSPIRYPDFSSFRPLLLRLLHNPPPRLPLLHRFLLRSLPNVSLFSFLSLPSPFTPFLSSCYLSVSLPRSCVTPSHFLSRLSALRSLILLSVRSSVSLHLSPPLLFSLRLHLLLLSLSSDSFLSLLRIHCLHLSPLSPSALFSSPSTRSIPSSILSPIFTLYSRSLLAPLRSSLFTLRIPLSPFPPPRPSLSFFLPCGGRSVQLTHARPSLLPRSTPPLLSLLLFLSPGGRFCILRRGENYKSEQIY